MSDDPVWSRDEPASPCQGLCLLHPVSNLSHGCLRNAEEIRSWGSMTAGERREILSQLPARKPLIAGTRRGGKRR